MPVSPKSLANLRPPKFRAPNSGRQKGQLSIINLIKEQLIKNDYAQANTLAQAMIKNAGKGNPAAIKEIMNRVDGVLAERHEIDFAGDISAHVAAVMQSQGKKTEKDP